MTDTYRTFTTTRFKVVCSIEPDYDADLSWDETGETLDNLNSGVWQCFRVAVKVYCDGREIASDYLCGCIHADPSEFFREHIGLAIKSRDDGCNYGAYFPDMIRTACAEAREYIRNARALPYVRESAA